MISAIIYCLLVSILVFWWEFGAVRIPASKDPGEQLEDWLKNFRWGGQAPGAAPSYKFYTEVVEVLLTLARKLGGHHKEALLFLREGLQADRQFERRLKDLVTGTWIQMLLMMALTWTFIGCSLWLVEVKFPLSRLFLIALWQGIGLACLPLAIKQLRQKLFGDIGKLWRMLYVLSSLATVPLSRTEVFSMAQIGHITGIVQKNLLPIVAKLKDTCERALRQGGSYEQDVRYLMDELRLQERWHFELFEKRLTALKLGLLAVFFLPSYLAFIFLLLGDLLVSM